MKSTAESLKQFYDSFIGQTDDRAFYIGLSDYIDHILSVPEAASICGALLEQKKQNEQKVANLEPAVLKKLDKVHKEILAYVAKNKIDRVGINEALAHYDAWLNGKVIGGDLPSALQDRLEDLISFLYEIPEHKDFAKKYITFSKDKTLVHHYFYPKEYSDYDEAKAEFGQKYKNELWGQVCEIMRLYRAIKNGKEISPNLFDVKNIRLAVVRLQNHILALLTDESADLSKAGKNKVAAGTPKVFNVDCGDREIKVNEYVISRPYAVGCPRELFDYVREKTKKKPNEIIKKKDMPEWLIQEIGRKRLVAIIAGVGFTGEIKKAFFPIVSKTSIKYRGDRVTAKELVEAGVKVDLLIKQLQYADAKNRNSPK
jgi:hypothetical protein